jgi:hypothetical protein
MPGGEDVNKTVHRSQKKVIEVAEPENTLHIEKQE